MEDTEYYAFDVKKMYEISSDFPNHCFTHECLRAVLTLIYDYYTFKSAVYKECRCQKKIFNRCNCLNNFPTSLRSFYFVEIKNEKGILYEKTNSNFIENVMKEM